jgi:hypothetical protein
VNHRTPNLCSIAAAICALGCDPRGVSVGTEELCIADPTILRAESHANGERVSSCARLGENRLVNAGFETPVVGNCENGAFCQFPAADVEGWDTTSGEQVIEIWHDQHMSVPAPEGSQFVELDATSQDTVSQDVALPPGQLMYWSFLHHGRIGIESVELRIGPPNSTTSQGVFTSAADAWYPYSGLYRVGDSERLTRFALVSRTGLAEGNLLDSIVFAPVD